MRSQKSTLLSRFPDELLQLDQIECGRGVFHGQACKTVVKVEGFRSRRNRMNDHEPRRDFAGGAKRAADGIGEERTAEAPTLASSINRQPPEHDGRDEVRHISAHRTDGLASENLPHAQGEKANDLK